MNPKRLTALLISLFLVLGMLPAPVLADDVVGGYCGVSSVNSGQNVIWRYTPATAVLSIFPNPNVSGQTNFNIANYTSSTHAPWYDYRESITAVEVESGVTGIGDYSFHDLSVLTGVTLPASLKAINQYAFCGCASLTGFEIPAGVTSIGNAPFYGCSSISAITVDAANTAYMADSGALYSKDGTTLCIYPEGRTSSTFTVPGCVTKINSFAFRQNGHLIRVTVPEGVTSIGSRAFFGCGNLRSVDLPSTVTSINGYTFGNCPRIENLDFIQNVTSIANYAFYQCTGLTSARIPDGVTVINNAVFKGCTGLTSATLHEGVTSIGTQSFMGCSSLPSLHVPSGVTQIGDAAFSGCASLEYICSHSNAVAQAYCETNSIPFHTCYTVSMDPDMEHGSLTADKDCYIPGQTVTLTDHPAHGWVLAGITVTDADNEPVASSGLTFEMPAGDVTVAATFAQTSSIDYLDANGETQTVPVGGYGLVTALDTEWTDGWYAAAGDVAVPERITATGDVHLILCDGAALTLEKGIELLQGNSITIYAQSTGDNMGALIGTSDRLKPVIGGQTAGAITINGGRISAVPGDDASGLGARWSSNGDAITINGGEITVTVVGANNVCAAINVGSAGIVINGGVINAGTQARGSAIGGGAMNNIGPIVINGGVINAVNGTNNGIGTDYTTNGTIIIRGGQITANKIGCGGAKAVLELGWTEPDDYIEAAFRGTITWADHFANALTPNEYCVETTLTENVRLVPITGHPELEHVDAVAPTCTEEGCVEHYRCAVCGRSYSDPSGENEIDPVLPIVPHTGVHVDPCDPDGPSMGYLEHYRCSVCGGRFSDEACENPISPAAVMRVPYLNENGTYSTLEPGGYQLLDEYAEANGSGMSVPIYSGMYVVYGDICEDACYYSVKPDENVGIVLCDGSKLSFYNPSYTLTYLTVNAGATLSIYAQSTGADMGRYGFENNGFINSGTLNIYGGRFDVGPYSSSSGNWGLMNYTNQENAVIRICGGEITSRGGSQTFSIGARTSGTVEICGGCVSAGDYGISGTNVRLGWTNMTDRITAASYSGTVTLMNSFVFDDDGSLIPATLDNIAGRTLMPPAAVSFDPGEGSGSMAPVTVAGGELFTLPECTFTAPAGKVFRGWEAGGVLYPQGASVTVTEANFTVTAVWIEPLGQCGPNAYWILEDGVLTIFGTGETYDYNSTDNPSPWSEESFFSAVIESGITSIGNYAFSQCIELESVSIPEGVTSIGNYAFSQCTGLESVSIPEGVRSIGNSAFRSCTALAAAVIPDSVTSLGTNIFTQCSSLGEIVIGSGVAIIPQSAFYKCTSLREVVIPEGVTDIRHFAFENCTALRSVTVPDSVVNIGTYAFFGCSGLSSLSLGSGVASIGNYAFSGCSSLAAVTLPEGLTSLGGSAFHSCCNLTEIAIPDGIAAIEKNTFYSCTDLRTVSLGSGITSIGESAFQGCNALTGITIPDGVTTIGDKAFSSCIHLTSVHIPAAVTSIGSSAFFGCTRLEYLCSPIPDGAAAAYCEENDIEFRLCGFTVTIINSAGGSITADKTEDLTEREPVTLTAEPEGENILVELIVTDANGDPVEVTDNAFLMPASDVTVTAVWGAQCGETAYWRIEDGVLIIFGTGWTYDFGFGDDHSPWAGMEFTSAVIGDGITRIGNCAFYNQQGLASVTIGSGVENIGLYAFKNCTGLGQIVIPDSTEHIDEGAFTGCSALASVSFGSSLYYIGAHAFECCIILESAAIPDSVGYLGEYAFAECCSMTSVSIGSGISILNDSVFSQCGSIQSITIPASVTSICENAFQYCVSLQRVHIPASVTHLGNYAFENCWDLTEVISEANVDEINDTVFYSCDNLDTIVISGADAIGEGAFCYRDHLVSVTLGSGVHTVGAYAFHGCGNLYTVDIGDDVETIAGHAFEDCHGLQTLLLGDSLYFIGESAFLNCDNSAFYSLVIPDSVAFIEGWAFANCTSLGEVTFGSGLAAIGQGAFHSCFSLQSIHLQEGLMSIGESAFAYCNLVTSAHIPSTIGEIGYRAFDSCCSLEYICSPVSDGVTEAYCAENDIEFRLCGLTVTVEEGITGGTVAADKTGDLTEKELVTLTAEALEGYEFAGWIVTDANGDPVEVTDNTFAMPASSVTVSALFRRTGGMAGDADCDGDITLADVSALAAFLVNSGTLSEQGVLNADANGDGIVNILDAAAICAMLMND